MFTISQQEKQVRKTPQRLEDSSACNLTPLRSACASYVSRDRHAEQGGAPNHRPIFTDTTTSTQLRVSFPHVVCLCSPMVFHKPNSSTSNPRKTLRRLEEKSTTIARVDFSAHKISQLGHPAIYGGGGTCRSKVVKWPRRPRRGANRQLSPVTQLLAELYIEPDRQKRCLIIVVHRQAALELSTLAEVRRHRLRTTERADYRQPRNRRFQYSRALQFHGLETCVEQFSY